MDCIAPVERLHTGATHPLGWQPGGVRTPGMAHGGTSGRRKDWPSCSPGYSHVLKDAKQTALLGRTKVNQFNANFRDDFRKSAWAECILMLRCSATRLCCLRVAGAWGNGIPPPREKFSRSKEQRLGKRWLWRAGSRGEGPHSFTVS